MSKITSKFTLVKSPVKENQRNLRNKRKVTFDDFKMLDSDEIELELVKEETQCNKKRQKAKAKDDEIKRRKHDREEAEQR
jgi:hypothetical protein